MLHLHLCLKICANLKNLCLVRNNFIFTFSFSQFPHPTLQEEQFIGTAQWQKVNSFHFSFFSRVEQEQLFLSPVEK